MSLNGSQDGAQYSVRSDKEKLNLIAKLICYVHRDDKSISAMDLCCMIKDIHLNEVDDEVEELLDMWIDSAEMQNILYEDEVRH